MDGAMLYVAPFCIKSEIVSWVKYRKSALKLGIRKKVAEMIIF